MSRYRHEVDLAETLDPPHGRVVTNEPETAAMASCSLPSSAPGFARTSIAV